MSRRRTRLISLPAATAFGIALAALLIIALFPIFPRQLDIRAGDIASRTLEAPRSVSFVSEFLTEQRREEAAEAVPPTLVYDPSVRESQVREYNATVAQVTQIRDQDTDEERKRDVLASLQLSPRSVDSALALGNERWQMVVAEGRRVLEEQLSVSLDDVTVTGAKDGIDALIGPEFFAGEALLAAELVRPRIIPTLTVDQDRTAEARAAARAAVAPERINVSRGDVIVEDGARVDEVAIEKLRAADVLSQNVEWDNVAAVSIISVIAAGALAAYLFVLQPPAITSERHMIALALIISLPLLVSKFYLPLVLPDEDRTFVAYALPIAAASLLVAALLQTEVALVVAAIMAILTAFISAFLPDVSLVASIGALDTLRLLLVYGLGPLAGIYLVHEADRLSRYLTAGIAVAVVSYGALLATWFVDVERETADVGWMALAAGVGGVSSGVLAAGAFVTVGVIFGVTTRVQLMELSQLNSPLLRRLQDEAPGTFHHSIIVGNLAERAADLVGADPLLTRVGCYYHDIGKVLQPGMYVENQLGGDSPHDTMTPEESTEVIQQHVRRGLEIAKRERLPVRVQAFIPEHHGTRLVAYFYRRAAERDPGVDPALFQYPGPKPQTRETAIVMLADSTEAVVRAAEDRSPDQIDRMVDEVIAERLAEGQLDESDLTLRDLRTIAESFKGTMRAVYHPRVQYPEPTPMEARRRVLRLPLRALERDRSSAPVRRPRKFDL